MEKDMKKYQNTYCNPLPLPNYPIGRRCREYEMEDFRETADPTVIYEGGKWYMYPSCGMAYYSEDFVSWKHHKIEPFDDIGYAPTVVKHKNKFYLTACSADLWVSDSPLGPFSSLGAFTGVDGKIYRVDDPMIFSDDDSRLYLYWGCGGEGIFGVELADRQAVIPYAKRLQEMGAGNVLVSLAGEGAVLAAEDGNIYEAPAPKGKLINGVGAGDSMVAGFLAGWMRKKDYRHAFHMGMAAGSASAFSEFLATREEVMAVYRQLAE